MDPSFPVDILIYLQRVIDSEIRLKGDNINHEKIREAVHHTIRSVMAERDLINEIYHLHPEERRETVLLSKSASMNERRNRLRREGRSSQALRPSQLPKQPGKQVYP
jgi:hypothetical protein